MELLTFCHLGTSCLTHVYCICWFKLQCVCRQSNKVLTYKPDLLVKCTDARITCCLTKFVCPSKLPCNPQVRQFIHPTLSQAICLTSIQPPVLLSNRQFNHPSDFQSVHVIVSLLIWPSFRSSSDSHSICLAILLTICPTVLPTISLVIRPSVNLSHYSSILSRFTFALLTIKANI